MPARAEAVVVKAPRPRVYKSKDEIFRAHGAKYYYVKSVPPASTLIGVPVKGGINWYDKDFNVKGYVLRATTLQPGQAQVFRVPESAGSLGQVAEPGQTATTIDEATKPTAIPPPGYEWLSVGPADPQGWNWMLIATEEKGRFPIGWAAAGVLFVLGILYWSRLR